jgi:hypothetical protein
MNRRDFFKRLAAVTAVGTAGVLVGQELDLERLLWVPGEKSYFLPPPKPLITDVDLLAQEYKHLVDPLLALKCGVYHQVHTAVGLVESDAQWNVIRVGGKKVSAEEAARHRLNHFSRHGHARNVGPVEVAQMTQQILGERFAAGWSFADATAGLSGPVSGLPLIAYDAGAWAHAGQGAPHYGWPVDKSVAVGRDNPTPTTDAVEILRKRYGVIATDGWKL